MSHFHDTSILLFHDSILLWNVRNGSFLRDVLKYKKWLESIANIFTSTISPKTFCCFDFPQEIIFLIMKICSNTWNMKNISNLSCINDDTTTTGNLYGWIATNNHLLLIVSLSIFRVKVFMFGNVSIAPKSLTHSYWEEEDQSAKCTTKCALWGDPTLKLHPFHVQRNPLWSQRLI